MKTDPHYPFAYWRRGLAYEQLGKAQEAQADFKQAYDLGMQDNPEKFKEYLKDNPDIAKKLLPKE
jgi:Tfp pilus assembly protein PilF